MANFTLLPIGRRKTEAVVRRIRFKEPILLLVMGAPGSGKSTVSKSLLETCNFVYLDNNFIADSISRDSRVDDAYLELRRLVYDSLYRIASENLKVRNSVLLDVPHITHMTSTTWRDEINASPAQPVPRSRSCAATAR